MTTAVEILRAAATRDDPWAGFETEEPPPAANGGARARRPRPEAPKYEFKWHEPTGRTGWPVIVISGGEYAGKSTTAAEFTASKKIGQSWWLPIGEDPEPHGAIPDARYRVVEHDGSWWQILAAARALDAEARAAVARGDKPTLVIVDTMSAEWLLLSGWAENRARRSSKAQELLSRDPNAAVQIDRMYWNDANARHRALMKIFKEMPAIVVLTARGKMVSATLPTGQPDNDNPKVWTVEAQKDIGFESQAFVRLDRALAPAILGVRLPPPFGIRPGDVGAAGAPFVFDGVPRHGRPGLSADKFSLEWLVFGLLKFDPANAGQRNTYDPKPDALPDGDPVKPAPEGSDEKPGSGPATSDVTPERNSRG